MREKLNNNTKNLNKIIIDNFEITDNKINDINNKYIIYVNKEQIGSQLPLLLNNDNIKNLKEIIVNSINCQQNNKKFNNNQSNYDNIIAKHFNKEINVD